MTGFSVDVAGIVDDIERGIAALAEQRRQRQLRDALGGGIGQRQRRGHAERDAVAGVGQREFREIGARRGIGRRRDLAQLRGVFLVGLRPQRDGGDAVLGAADQRFRDRDHGFLLGKARDADRGLAGGHHLPGIDQGRGDDAAGVGDQRRIGQRVLGQFDRALGAVETRARFVGGGAALIHLRIGGPALGAQILGALLGGGGLRQHAGGGAEFGLGLLGLQLQIDFIEGGERLADIDGLADLDQALCHLAGNPKAHVGLDPGLDGADEAALRRFRLVMHGRDQHRAPGSGLFGHLLVAAGQREHRQRPAISSS